MNETTITVRIADRPYRLTVGSHEEEHVKKAVRLIGQKVEEYSKSYAFTDKQDLLAMVALQFTTSFLNGEKVNSELAFESVRSRLDVVLEELDKHLGRI